MGGGSLGLIRLRRLTPPVSGPDTCEVAGPRALRPRSLLTLTTYPSKVTEENGDIQDCSSAPGGLDDWPIDVADLRESLRESEADIAAGRTFGEDEIRARYGVPRK